MHICIHIHIHIFSYSGGWEYNVAQILAQSCSSICNSIRHRLAVELKQLRQLRPSGISHCLWIERKPAGRVLPGIVHQSDQGVTCQRLCRQHTNRVSLQQITAI